MMFSFVKFGLICLTAGTAMAVLGIGVEDFWLGVADTAKDGGEWVTDNEDELWEYALDYAEEYGERAWPYALAGAGVAGPIYLLRFLIGRARRRRRPA